MSTVSIVRQRYANGDSIRKIAREEHLSRNTVAKYIRKDDFSPAPPFKETRASRLDPHKDFIDRILEDDRCEWRKQRHTATRIFERLKDEHGFDCSYSMVQTYVRDKKAQMRQGVSNEYNDLLWDPGFIQVDFGEADFREGDTKSRKDFLVVAFPHSNQGFSQVFDGGTSECLCQGLKDIFEFIGGVPHTAIFDNATAAGRRVCNMVRESELFSAFRMHYGFDARFCNPDSGHEKGTVENKVDWVRHNLFVPVPDIGDVIAFNRRLLVESLKQGKRIHYSQDVPVSELFSRDQAACRPLPRNPFDVVRYERYKTSKYGHITIDGCHVYSVSPQMALRYVLVALRANEVVVLDEDGKVLARHQRYFGKRHTESIDHASALGTLANKPRSWQQSRLRHAIDDELRDFLDMQPRDMLVSYLRCMHEQSKNHDLNTILSAMCSLIRRGGAFSTSDVAVMVQRMDGFGIGNTPDKGPSLVYYDDVLLGVR